MPELHGDLDALVTEVHRRVEQRALEREAMAEKRAQELLERADEEVRRTLRSARERAHAQAEELRMRARARAEMEAKRIALRSREELLESVWSGAREALVRLCADPATYRATLRRLARMACAALGAPEIVLASDAHGRALLTEDTLDGWGREDGVRYLPAEAPLEGRHGLEASAGRLRCDLSFETRLDEAREMLRDETAARLMPAAPPTLEADGGETP